jgi:hypothetical protein
MHARLAIGKPNIDLFSKIDSNTISLIIVVSGVAASPMLLSVLIIHQRQCSRLDVLQPCYHAERNSSKPRNPNRETEQFPYFVCRLQAVMTS